MKKITCLMVLTTTLTIQGIMAQQALSSSGGDASGSGGTTSYSAGQIAYNAISSAGDTVTEGIQQPYEIFVLDNDQLAAVSLTAMVYPNPTVSSVSLQITFPDLEGLRYELFDFNGRLITADVIIHSTTLIDMESLADAAYILNVYTGMYRLKSFKIIKRNR